MISGIVLREHEYVLKDDRASNPEDQTVFQIVPKTVRSQNETAARYAGVSTTDKKTGVTKLDKRKLDVVDDEEWGTAVKGVRNYFCPEGAPESDYEFFLEEKASGASYLKEATIKGIKGLLIVSTKDQEPLRRIRLSMCPDHVSEVMDAYYNYSQLSETEKNG